MPNSKIFCNAPWYELHIYWDGSMGFCCQESHKLYPAEQDSIYNIKNTTIREWFDSEPMRSARMGMFGDKKNSFCSRCYAEESVSDTSRRHRSNQKSVIFTRTAFKKSYDQSPGHHKFELTQESLGAYDGMPIDLHIDLGNYCNLACKMCNPQASSNIAVQHVKWGIESARQYIGTDWTQDQLVWDQTLEEISQINNLKNIHFMGGETLLTKRFEDFVDFMLAKGRTDLNFSFVTNGTVFNETLMKKLLQFDRVGIEVSIETVTQHNSYQRQGTDTDIVIKNIRQYQQYCDDSRITITVRPAISLLTIGYYHTLLEYCLQQKLIVKSLICYNPKYYNPAVLPDEIKLQYIKKYQKFLDDHNLIDVDCVIDYNESDPNQLLRIIKNQVLQCINILSSPQPADADNLLKEMVKQSKRWDQIYGYNARSLYPEFEDIFNQHGY
jgi:pyruvate-formate lyase-activating enzyme